MATGVVWLDKIVEQANFPPDCRPGGRRPRSSYGELTGFTPSKHTIRSWRDLPYRIVGRSAIYQVPDVIEHARKRFEEPVRTGSKLPAAAATYQPT